MRPEEEVALLADLVAIPSPSGEERAAVECLTERLARWGLESFVDEAGNARAGAGDGERVIVLLGHIDTVSGFPAVRRDGDRLYGRGTVDAKGPLCAFAAAMARLEPGDLAGKRVLLCGAVEEEAPTSRGARFLRDQVRPQFCVVGEPSGWHGVTLGYKGRIGLEAEVCATCSHSAGREPTAAERGAALWDAIRAEAAARGGEREFDRVVPTLSAFDTERGDFEERARLEVSLRLPEGFDPAGFERALRDAVPEARLTFHGHEPAFRGDRKNALVRAFLRGIRRAGGKPRFVLKTGTSDMNVVGPRWGGPIVAYGPGDSALDHTPDEHILVSEYLRAVGVLAAVLRDL